MATKKKRTDQPPASDQVAAPKITISGFLPAPWIVSCSWPDLQPADGAEQLWVKLERISVAEADALPWGKDVKYEDLWCAIAPHVLAWNVMAVNRETGEREVLPPPAEAGPDIFTKCDRLIAAWIASELRWSMRIRPQATPRIRPPAASESTE